MKIFYSWHVLVFLIIIRFSENHFTKRRAADFPQGTTIGYGSCMSIISKEKIDKFLKFFTKHNTIVYFKPDTQIFNEFLPIHRQPLSSATSRTSCESEISLELFAELPILQRSLCPYRHVLNYNPKRIPSSISEVECTCQQVPFNGGTLHCEEMYYHVKVLVSSDEECDNLEERDEKIALACLPVFSNQISAGIVNVIRPTHPTVPV